MLIKTENSNIIKLLLKKLYIPSSNSHKGQNGRVLVIGGSSLFHSASIWAAEIASHFADIVHYSSTKENNKIFLSLKKKFRNGIVVSQRNLPEYVKEDDAILTGPGMIRKFKVESSKLKVNNFEKLIKIGDEGDYTYYLTKFLIESFPEKRFVFDAGALQMMEKDWLLKLKERPIVTPHQREFKQLFGIDLRKLDENQMAVVVKKTAYKYQCVILLKAIIDIISDGEEVYIIKGGNAGLTKGGVGDLLAGLVLSFAAKNNQLLSAVLASYFLKKSADRLFIKKGYWYNIDDLIEAITQLIKKEI
jgi:NAD(P)H-hydrate epimerase